MLALIDQQGGYSKVPAMTLQVGKEVPTTLTTVGAGVLTADMIVSGVVLRSGPTGAYSDTTDTAAAILAYIGDSVAVGQSFDFTIVNGVAFAETIVAGVGVTLAGVTVNAASAIRMYRCTVTSATTVTITGIGAMSA